MCELSSGDLAKVWEKYKQSDDQDAKEKLILHYAPLVQFVAGRLSIGLPPSIDIDDLLSYGFFGLVDAIERFDLSRKVKFETYATQRIRGSMIDGLRAIDWVPRSVRQKAKRIEDAIGQLELEMGRPPKDKEVARYLEIDTSEYYQMLNEVKAIGLLSLDEFWRTESEEDGSIRLQEMVEDKTTTGVDPSALVATDDVKKQLAEAIEKLPERERLVISLYYYDELTLKEIGSVLSVSESRVSQLHSKAMLRLRSSLKRYKESMVI